uniref:Uncharacterized protein n=1 Tax=viral metagenome TaxID=1070528 RepID=A0A6C0K5L3_9ZZZZ
MAIPSTIPSGSKRKNSITGGTMIESLNSLSASHRPGRTVFGWVDDIRSI